MSVRLAAPRVHRRARAQSGFSLIELLLAGVVVVVVAAIIWGIMAHHRETARRGQAFTDIRDISQAIQHFYGVQMHLPADLADLGMANRRDPWGHRYRYIRLAGAPGSFVSTDRARWDRYHVPINTDFDLYSTGPNGQSNRALNDAAGRDDIVRANNGAFIGTASDY